MTRKPIYIQAVEQISMQSPLSQAWMGEPKFYTEPLVYAQNPNFRDFIPANEVRRMGKIMKRALVTTLKVLQDTDTPHPDAIITGTSIGSLDYTERFLDAMIENGEETLSPTYFMQSTHNTVSSALSIYTKSHGYNTTYSHGGISFDLAVLDAWMQMQLGKINTALVGGHDEMVDSFFSLLQKRGFVGLPGMVPCGEVAMSMLLSTEPSADALCELVGIRLGRCAHAEQIQKQLTDLLHDADMKLEDISAVLIGTNGNPENDAVYDELLSKLSLNQLPLMHYKHLFGENYTASALGMYVAAHCLKQQRIPDFLYQKNSPRKVDTFQNLLLINQMHGNEVSLTLLKSL